jgi:serine/threonine protein kinase
MVDRPYMPPGGTESGDVVGGYELLREIGRGGMAEVWVARRANATTGKFVAIKLILPQYAGDERYMRMFRSEAEVSAPLSHSNIVQVFDEGVDRGRSYLVMEWVDGIDLARMLPDMAQLRQRDPFLRLRVAAYVIGQVLHGLSYAHKVTSHRGALLGIVHRDISPQNILISVSGDVKVTDFGIAHRMIEETSGINVKGKLRYMAPEQLAGKSHAPTVDLYAVGALLHELLTGEKFRSDAEDHMALYRQVMDAVVPPMPCDDVPAELEAVRMALLHPDEKKRPQTADAALLMIKRWSGYSEMRVELSMICGLATGVVRPRTGPSFEQGQPTVAPPGGGVPRNVSRPSQGEAPASVVPTMGGAGDDGTAVLSEGEMPFSSRARSEPTAMLQGDGPLAASTPGARIVAPPAVDPRDVEPTHSSVGGRWGTASAAMPAAEPTSVSRVDHAVAPRMSTGRLAILIGGGATFIAIAAGVTGWWLTKDSPARTEAARTEGVAAQPEPASAPAAPDAPGNAAVVEPRGPVLQPKAGPTPTVVEPAPAADAAVAAVAVDAPVDPAPEPAPEPDPAPAPSKTTAEPTPTPKPTPAAKPTPSTKPTQPAKPATTTPKPKPDDPPATKVIVRFRLEGGLTGADVKLGSLVIPVRPHYDTTVPSGTYAAKWRADPGDKWKSAGKVVLGTTGEWKFFIGPSGARASKL